MPFCTVTAMMQMHSLQLSSLRVCTLLLQFPMQKTDTLTSSMNSEKRSMRAMRLIRPIACKAHHQLANSRMY